MAEHEHGTMSSEVQEKTFDGFVKGVGWGAVVCILILIFMAVFNG